MVMTVPSGPRSLGDVYVPMSISTGISIIIAKSVGRGGVSGSDEKGRQMRVDQMK